MHNCSNCKYSEKVANKGEEYQTLSPHGNEITRQHPQDLFMCRYFPPTKDGFPLVDSETWCGKYSERIIFVKSKTGT